MLFPGRGLGPGIVTQTTRQELGAAGERLARRHLEKGLPVRGGKLAPPVR